jgi:putative DNA primase/helicase
MEININRIRDEMKNREQWLCWETAMRDGKETKLPKDPKTGEFAQTDDPSTWGSFLNANGKVKAGQMDGVGFVFTEDDNYVGIDLDNCRDPETGEWEDWALDVMEDIGGWIEISPSGTGAHIILKGGIPGDRNRKGDIEMYEDGRFFTVTGQLVDENGDRLDDDEETPDIKEAQQALDAVYDRFLAEDDESANETDIDVDPDKWGHLNLENHDSDSRPSQAGDANLNNLPAELREIVETAKSANNGYQFTQLWRGNWKDYYPSHSEGDMGFCDMLAFWFSGDPERMDRVFRASGLMRPKWDDVRYSDGSTYGERTIEKAIAEVDDHYDEEYYNDLVDEEEDGTDGNTDAGDESDTEVLESTSDNDNEDNNGDAGFSSESASNTKSSSSDASESDEVASSDTSSRSVEDGSAKDAAESRDEARVADDGRSRKRGRGRGRKRGQKRRDGIPDDFVVSTSGEPEDSESSPGPKGTSDDENEEEYYTELNFDTDGDAGEEESDEGLDDDDMFDSPPRDDQDEEEFPPEDEAASIFDDAGEEETSTPPGSETGSTDTVEDNISTDSSTKSTSPTETDSSRDTSSSSSTTDSSDRSSRKDRGQDERSSKRTSEQSDDLEQRFDRFETETGTRLEDIQQELSRLDEELETTKAELRHDIELEDDKLERVYWELQQYEKIVDKRENQLETMYQLLVLICHGQPEPLFDRIENILLNAESIPPENIFNESVEEIIEHYNEDTSPAGSEMGTEPTYETADEQSRTRRRTTESSTEPSQPTGDRTRTDGNGDISADDIDENEDEEDSFLSQFF